MYILLFLYCLERPLCPLRSSMFSSTMLWWRASWAERQRSPPGSCTVTSTASSRPTRQAARSWRSSSGWVILPGAGPVRSEALSPRAVCTACGLHRQPKRSRSLGRELVINVRRDFPDQDWNRLRASLMLAILMSRLSPLPPHAKLDECFIKLLLPQHQERETNCSHIMSLPPERHMLVINMKVLLFILGVKQHHIFCFSCLIWIYSESQRLQSDFYFRVSALSLTSFWLSATRALWSASVPTKTATRRRTATPQWFPVSILSVLPQHTRSWAEVLGKQGHVEHVKPLRSGATRGPATVGLHRK